MKLFLRNLVLATFITSNAFAQAEDGFEDVWILWEKDHLIYNVTLECDDAYQVGADITIPGKMSRDFGVSINADAGYDKCEVISKNFDGVNTTVRVRANEGCEFSVKNKKTKRIAIVNFASC